MEFYSLNGFPTYTDDFYWRELSDNSDKAIVIHNPQDAHTRSQFYPHSTKTLEEHIEYIQVHGVKSAIIVADDISFLKNCTSLEKIMVFPSASAVDFDYSPLYALPNIKWLQCETVYGKNDEKVAEIDYSHFPNLERVLIGEGKNLNIQKAQNVSILHFYSVRKEKSIAGKIPPAVREFSITDSSTQSLDGIEAAKQIFELKLQYNRSLRDISSLKKVKDTLKFLEIYNCGKIDDFSVLHELSNIEVLHLMGNNKIESLSFLEKMPKLRFLKLTMNVLDGDLTLCTKIPYVYVQNRKHYSHNNEELPKDNICL